MTGAAVALIGVFGLVWLALVGIGMAVPATGRLPWRGRPPWHGRPGDPAVGSRADGDGADGGGGNLG